jgi:hypothetical protein
MNFSMKFLGGAEVQRCSEAVMRCSASVTLESRPPTLAVNHDRIPGNFQTPKESITPVVVELGQQGSKSADVLPLLVLPQKTTLRPKFT